ncbi:hypothetical protein CGRA01v4_13515 [Colletotrichum graminicola]|uniref:GPI anchored protein n=1 Tax=Colletotrichum graminicola (strain M1.001 / M2 / FGSC 10212) TaxID=645133 RepID=E3QRT1_COLGM|nr:uncharacterized protein GLRG_08848 [Colletotrichum graminicola M1.001]EFQ33569.1 hypothetical protein GLRG_08848 [Colletotrichum graminicola M1.001]WDK22224.1 hypothetical protein CGRA01v4_13515 [Colletotrichum graminicola]
MLPSFFLAFLGGILLIPAQAEEAPTLKSLGSLPSFRISRSGLPVSFAAVGGKCDTGSVKCNDRCMPEGECDGGETCTAGDLCSRSAGDVPNCDPGTTACGNRCMPSDAVCCDGGSYCDTGQICVEGGSCRKGDDKAFEDKDESTTTSMPPAITADLGDTSGEHRTTAAVRGTAAPTTMSASAGALRGAYVNKAALAVGLCAAVSLVI